MDLKQFLISTIPSERYYQKRYPSWNTTARPNQHCPWHDDTKPSLSVGLSGGGARCHACDKSLGNIVHFEAQLRDCSDEQASRDLYSEFVRPIVDESILASLQSSFTPTIAAKICGDTGITVKGIDMFALGWCPVSKRLAIPIWDRFDNLINIRLYKPPVFRTAKDENLKVLNLKGFGGCDLFSWPHFVDFSLDKPIFVMPSEKEMILAMQFGLQAVCATAGEMAWPEEWTELFTGYDIAIVAQRDKTGRDAAAKKLAALQPVSNFCAIIEPPTELKDFGDFVQKENGQGIHLLAEFESARRRAGGGLAPLQTPPASATSQSFPSDTSKPALPPYWHEEIVELAAVGTEPAMLNRIVKVTGIIAAKATNTYTIPWRFKVRAKRDAQRLYAVGMGRRLLSFIKAGDVAIRESLREELNNPKAEIEPESFITATEVEVIPTASIEKDVPYVTQRCYFIGTRVEANIPYDLEIIPTTDPRSQETVGIIVKATAIARAVEAATFSPDELAALQIFKPAGEESVWDKMLSVADELSRYQTKIFNRPDWHLVAALTWLSPIGWEFPYEKEIQRGWLNSLAIGDTQTGKSKVSQQLQRLFRCGSIINAENCTYVGLVGGAIKMGSGQFMLRWGRIPLCDKQLVVIEELSGLSVEEISHMSDVRSSGIARLDKGGLSAETNARTRLLILSNVRPVNRNLAGYLSGVKAIQELIGHGEDIARFDLISTLVDHEVPNDVINRPFSNKGVRAAIPDELWQKLCQFVWALKPSQVKITTEAYYECLDQTKRLAEMYHPSVPVFKGGSGRYKIARVAAAIACMQFSWNGKVLLVQEEHVQAAAQFLQMLYDKPSFGYLEWSQQAFDRDGVKNVKELDAKLIEVIRNATKRGKVVESLIHSGKFTRDELCAVASLQIIQADDLLGVMLRERVLRKGDANVWEITPAGKTWMQGHFNDAPV